jgi:hypothetical protein
VSYNASAVKNYIAASSLVRSENKNIFFYTLKKVLACHILMFSAGAVVVNSQVVRLSPD